MKKFAMLLAAGVIAFGASAQAASVASTDTYAVITIPVVAGDNLIGVSVDPLAANATLSAYLPSVDSVKVADEGGYVTTNATQFVPGPGDAFWYNAKGDGKLYEIGKDRSTAATVPLAGATLVATGKTTDWTPSAINSVFGVNSGVSANKYANMINIWDPTTSKYIQLWYRANTGWFNRANGQRVDETYKIHPGQGVILRPGFANEATSVSL